jgi:hypothetical protein
VFTEYRDTLTALAARFAAWSPLQLHGGMTARERRDATHGFSSGKAALLLATDAASEGLNLHQHCRLVVNLELPWTPARLEQRVGRVDRIGQRRPVHAVHLVASRTSEETVVARLILRTQRAANALGDDEFQGVEGDIAAAAIGGQDRPPVVHRRPADPAKIIAADPALRLAAEHEADSVLRARSLHPGAGHLAGPRPLLTVLRRPHRQRYWAFELEYADASGRILWREVVGLSSRYSGGHLGRPAGVRRALDVDASMTRAMEREHEARALGLGRALTPALAVAGARERAIAAAAAARRARLAAVLIQPGLFGRAGTAAHPVQTAAADELVRRCDARAREIDLAARPVVAGTELLFACVGV